jgi:hypothetical protein
VEVSITLVSPEGTHISIETRWSLTMDKMLTNHEKICFLLGTLCSMPFALCYFSGDRLANMEAAQEDLGGRKGTLQNPRRKKVRG